MNFYNLYTLLIRTPPFSGKRCYSNFFVHYYSVVRTPKTQTAFLTSRSASKRVLFALGVDPTARDTGESGGSDLVSQAMPLAVHGRLVSVSVPSPHKTRQASKDVKQML